MGRARRLLRRSRAALNGAASGRGAGRPRRFEEEEERERAALVLARLCALKASLSCARSSYPCSRRDVTEQHRTVEAAPVLLDASERASGLQLVFVTVSSVLLLRESRSEALARRSPTASSPQSEARETRGRRVVGESRRRRGWSLHARQLSPAHLGQHHELCGALGTRSSPRPSLCAVDGPGHAHLALRRRSAARLDHHLDQARPGTARHAHADRPDRPGRARAGLARPPERGRARLARVAPARPCHRALHARQEHANLAGRQWRQARGPGRRVDQ